MIGGQDGHRQHCRARRSQAIDGQEQDDDDIVARKVSGVVGNTLRGRQSFS